MATISDPPRPDSLAPRSGGWTPLFETVTGLQAGAETIRRRRYGVIETAGSRLVSVRFRPFPKLATLPGVLFFGPRTHEHHTADRCRLYFNQPLRFPNFLALQYICSGQGTRLGTILSALATLDEIARIKQTDALLTDVLNWRISPKGLARYGWEPHKPSRWHRHYIKRFYGLYPSPPPTATTENAG
jgi:hypothetical protein